MTITLIALLPVSLGLSLAFTWIARSLAPRVHLVDRPDGRRKIHPRAIPVAGGIAIFAAGSLTLFLAWLVPGSELGQEPVERSTFLGLFLGCAGMVGLGVLDDLGHLRGRHKLLGQFLIVLLVISCGIVVHRVRLLTWEVDLGLLSYPFTVFLLLGAINSLNLLDGMDGLLSSVGLIICLALTGIAVMTGRWTTAYVTLALAGSLLGFLRYNFPPASIYLGDAGSMLIGLSIGVMAIQSSIKAQATVALAAPVGLLAIPIFDTTAAILRRKLTGRSIYTTDRGHLHHCLLAQGWGTRWTLLIISGSCALTAIGALVSLAFNNEWFGFLCALSVVSALVASRLFGHAELVLLFKRLASLGSSMTHFPSEERKGGYEVHLQGNMDWEQLWASISSSSQGLNLRSLSLDINAPILHENYYARWNSLAEPTDETENCWSAEVPLIIQGQTCGRIQVVGWQDSKPVWEKVALLAALGQDLEKKASKLAHKSIRPSPAHGLPEPHLQGLDQAARVQLATQVSEG